MKNLPRFILLLFLCLAANAPLMAQKVKLKNFKVNAVHANLPAVGFAPDVTTYDVRVNGDEQSLSRYGINLADISSRIKIGGYNKVDGGGSAAVVLSLGTPISSARQTQVTDKVDKDKNKYKLYKYYFNLETSGSYKVVDSKGNILSEKSMPKTKTISTKEFRSMSALNNSYKQNYPAAKTKALKALFNECVNELNTQINREYSVGKVTSRVVFEEVKSKGHQAEKDFAEAQATTEKAFAKMTLEDNAAFVATIQPAINYWVENESSFSTSDKQEKKLNYACRFNAALAYLWAEDFDNALKYADMIANGDYNEKRGKRLKEEIEGIVEKMSQLNLETRHFAVEVSQDDEAAVLAFAADKAAAYASGDIRAYPEFKEAMGVKMNSKVETGKLYYKGGNSSEGVFVYESITFAPDFRYPRNIRFGVANGQAIETGNPIYKNLDSIQIANTIYQVKPVTIGEGLLAVKLKNAIVEVVQDYDKARLEIAHPPAAGSKDNELVSSYVIWHKGKKKHYSPDGLSFAKSMKKVVGGCTPAIKYIDDMKAANKGRKLLDKISADNYKIEDLHQILALYDTCK